MILSFLLAFAAQDSVSSVGSLEFPDAMRPAFDIYMGCLQNGLNSRVEKLPASPVDFATVAQTVVLECKGTRAKAFANAQAALAPDPVPSPDNHAGVINGAFNGVEASFGDFVEQVRTAVEERVEKPAT